MSENPTPDVAEEEPYVIFDCQRCGLPLPPMEPELARMAKRSDTVLAHALCPGEEPKKSELRRFEVRVSIVELFPDDADDLVEDEEGDAYPREKLEEFVVFKAAVEAKDLDAAMRPLALELGKKWQAAEKQAKVADSDDD